MSSRILGALLLLQRLGLWMMIARDCLLVPWKVVRLVWSLEDGIRGEKLRRAENRSILHLQPVFTGDIRRDWLDQSLLSSTAIAYSTKAVFEIIMTVITPVTNSRWHLATWGEVAETINWPATYHQFSHEAASSSVLSADTLFLISKEARVHIWPR